MRDPLDPIEKVRLNDTLRVRAPPGFRQRVVAVAAAEGIGLAEFARRAIVERVRRLEQTEAPASDRSPASAATSPPSANTLSARAAGTPTTSGASASAATKPNRRDA